MNLMLQSGIDEINSKSINYLVNAMFLSKSEEEASFDFLKELKKAVHTFTVREKIQIGASRKKRKKILTVVGGWAPF